MFALFPSRAVALTILGFSIHWYGLLYLAGFLIAAFLLPRLQKYAGLHLHADRWYSLLSWSVIGVILGGRLGYILLYEPGYFLLHPLDVFAVWKGGMAFHGGFIGVIIVLALFCRAHKISLYQLGDVVVIPVAIGLALGRLGNFINQELYGTATTLPWGMQFPGVEGLRHPIQFYEMITDLLTAVICFGALRSKLRSGTSGALFLFCYGVARFLIEFVRDQQQYGMFLFLTRGQLYTLPLIIVGGVVLWRNLLRRSVRSGSRG